MNSQGLGRYGPGGWILAVLLIAYMGLMAVASCTVPLRPRVLDGPHAWANALLNDWGVVPGLEVFGDDLNEDLKGKAFCVYVIGHLRDGGLRRLYERPDDCRGVPLRWRSELFNQAMQMITITAFTNPAASPTFLASLSDYYCHSQQLANDDVQAISIAWHRLRKSYSTGRIEENLDYLFHWSCDEGKPLPKPWPTARDVLGDDL